MTSLTYSILDLNRENRSLSSNWGSRTFQVTAGVDDADIALDSVIVIVAIVSRYQLEPTNRSVVTRVLVGI
jgi:hypothetical protein